MNNHTKCDEPDSRFSGDTLANFLAASAEVCCKSREVDQTVCKVGKCVTGIVRCFAAHYHFGPAEKKITDPKAKTKNGRGSCALAIMNRVEGDLCCTSQMKQLATCVPKEAGDYRLCNDEWTTHLGPLRSNFTEAILGSFDKTGGYCAITTSTSSGNRGLVVVSLVAAFIGATAVIVIIAFVSYRFVLTDVG